MFGKDKILFTLGNFKKVAMMSNCANSVTPEKDRAKVYGYICMKKKQELVRDVLYSIYGDDWRIYE